MILLFLLGYKKLQWLQSNSKAHVTIHYLLIIKKQILTYLHIETNLITHPTIQQKKNIYMIFYSIIIMSHNHNPVCNRTQIQGLSTSNIHDVLQHDKLYLMYFSNIHLVFKEHNNSSANLLNKKYNSEVDNKNLILTYEYSSQPMNFSVFYTQLLISNFHTTTII